MDCYHFYYSLYEQKDKNRNFDNNFSCLGSIPFDIGVMNSFGERHFWDRIKKTLYYAGVVDVLNIISTHFNLLNAYRIDRIRPIPSIPPEKKVNFPSFTRKNIAFIWIDSKYWKIIC
jgi:hypothetical protein